MPRVANNGIAIHYRVEGSGSPLILQHGFADSSETWYELGYVAALKTKYQLILPDTRGHGQSDKPHDPQAYTPASFAADIEAVLDHAGLRNAFFWGYSQGGWIAFAMAQYATKRITRLVIGGAASAGSAYTAEPGKDDPLIAVLRRGAGELASLFGEWLTPALEQRLRANDAAALIACRQQRLVTHGFADVVGTIAVPTFLYAGSADPNPRCGAADRLTNSECQVYVDAQPQPHRGDVPTAAHFAAGSAVSGGSPLIPPRDGRRGSIGFEATVTVAARFGQQTRQSTEDLPTLCCCHKMMASPAQSAQLLSATAVPAW